MAFFVTIAALAQPLETALAQPPLIPRATLFGNPVRAQGLVSPDGRYLSWLAPRDGVLNVWVAPADRPQEARPLTAEKTRPIRQHFWAPDSATVLFLNDTGGDEDFHLFAVPAAGGPVRDLTPFPRTRARLVALSSKVSGRILVGLNNRDSRWHDVHALDLATGALTLLQRGDGFAGFLADEELNLRVAIRPNAAGGADYFRIEKGQVAATPFLSHGIDDAATTEPLGFSADGRTLYWIDARGRDTAGLFAMDWATGAWRLLHADARADVQAVILDPGTREPLAAAVERLRPEWTDLSPEVRDDLEFLTRELGNWSLLSQTLANDRWTVATDNPDRPSATFLFDRTRRTLERLFVSRPELDGMPLARMDPVEIRARDGLSLPSYLTLPAGTGERPPAPLPMVLLVHGGPWARDRFGFDPYAQLFANRGYAVLQVNFRGSTGFGKAFVNAGNGEWAGRMHDDLIDAVAWAVRERIADPSRVAIMGGSYGGYATLVGLSFTPQTFACGVDIVGPSNLATLLATIPPYWEAGRRQLAARMADPDTPDGRAWLAERSPLNRADRIVRPLLIAQGANDPRVKQAESDQIVAALKARGIPVTYVLFPDEGHGFARPENNIAFLAIAENFLARCLGGRAEPIGRALEASSLTVSHGAEFAPGLLEALGRR
ncbi:MAG: S9 family peptidase [Sphingomonadaceae bacterium]|nr:S9 family peptidase [Sphingomonadaceae bacterium]MDW8414011.1 S9 family peptidase [Thermaurantiacus sp.]